MGSRVVLTGVRLQWGARGLEPKFDEHDSLKRNIGTYCRRSLRKLFFLDQTYVSVCVLACVCACVFFCMSVSVLHELTILFKDILAGLAFNTKGLLLQQLFSTRQKRHVEDNWWKKKNSVVELTIRSKTNSVKHSWSA